VDPQAQQPTDAQPVDQDGASASDQPQEPASGLMNRFIRGVSGLFGRDDEASEPVAEQESAPAPTADEGSPPPPAQPTYTQADFDRAVQSRSDQLLARQQRDWAKSRADAGDLQPIRDMARRRDPWALQQLEQNGDTWELGEIKAQELREAQARENAPCRSWPRTSTRRSCTPSSAPSRRRTRKRSSARASSASTAGGRR
jgi:hypothetical protein